MPHDLRHETGLVDRGPDTPGVPRLVMPMAAGNAVCVRGSHEEKLVRALRGHDVRADHGSERSPALWGVRTGEYDGRGFPVRYPWAHDHRPATTVLYGQASVAEPKWVNGTPCLGTGCVFGGLTAPRYPQRELVPVPARRTWYGQ